ncbi:MAG: hypothetical protein VKJ85_15240 [Prochlorothrix sp.]|nr:hypothetical protein [Prochlorothrix sp.]
MKNLTIWPPVLVGSLLLALTSCTTPPEPPLASGSDPTAPLPAPPDPAQTLGSIPTDFPPAIETGGTVPSIGSQVSRQGGGLGDEPPSFEQVWGGGTLEENFVGWQGTYGAGSVVAYFRDFNGVEAQGERAEQVVVTLAADPADAVTGQEALTQALALTPADAQLDRVWQPTADTLAYRYQSKTLAAAIPDYGGTFVVWLQLTAPPAADFTGSPTDERPDETPDETPAEIAAGTDIDPETLPLGTVSPQPVLQLQLISGDGANL